MTMPPGLDLAQQAVLPTPDGGGITAGFQLLIGRFADAATRWCDLQDRAAQIKQVLPVMIPVVGVGSVPTPAATFIIDVGAQPQQGRQWTVRRWAVADAGDVAAAITGATRADLFVGKPFSVGVGSTRGAIHQWADATTTLPAVRIPSAGSILVQPQEHVFVTITGATTAGQQLALALTILDEPQASYSAVQEV